MKLNLNPVALAFGLATAPQPATAIATVAPAIDRVNSMPGLPMAGHQRAEVETGYELAFLAMTRGHGSEHSMDFIATALNVALVLSEMGFAPEYLNLIVRAQDGAFRAAQRGLATGRWAFNGADIATIREALDVHSAQLEAAGKRDIQGALAMVEHRNRIGVVYSLDEPQK